LKIEKNRAGSVACGLAYGIDANRTGGVHFYALNYLPGGFVPVG
jgi:hypothetical protein